MCNKLSYSHRFYDFIHFLGNKFRQKSIIVGEIIKLEKLDHMEPSTTKEGATIIINEQSSRRRVTYMKTTILGIS